VLCRLTSLRHLTVVAAVDMSHYNEDEEVIGQERPAGFDATAVSELTRLQSLRLLRLPRHNALRALPAQLSTLSR
jgi:hypothetical protein